MELAPVRGIREAHRIDYPQAVAMERPKEQFLARPQGTRPPTIANPNARPWRDSVALLPNRPPRLLQRARHQTCSEANCKQVDPSCESSRGTDASTVCTPLDGGHAPGDM